MEVTRRLMMIGLLGGILFASTTADIILQPGYDQQYHGTQVPKYSAQVPSQSPSLQQEETKLANEFERYKSLHRAIEGQLVHLIHEQTAENVQQTAPEVVGRPLYFRPRIIHHLVPHISGGRLFSLTPAGAYGLHLGGYGFRRHPVLLRETADPFRQQEYDAVRTQWARSITGGTGTDDEISGEVHAVAAQSTLDEDGVDGVVKFQVPEIPATDETIVNKHVESRQIGERDDAIVGSPLDRIHYENPRDNKDQHHPSESSVIPSNLMKSVNAVGNMIDSVAPGAMNHENKDYASAMTRHQDLAPNYRYYPQYPLLREQTQRTDSPRIWNAPTANSNNQPMTGQSYKNQQQSQNSGWSTIAPTQSSHSPKASNNVQHSRLAPAAYPAFSNSMNNKNWLTTTHRHHLGYPNYRPDYPYYYQRPPTGSYRPYVNDSLSYPSGATSSATANANNQSGFGNGPSTYNHGYHYPSGATSSATANANNQSGFGNGPSTYNHGYHYPSGATSSATENTNNQSGFGNGPSTYNHGYHYPSGATSSATENTNNQSGFGNGPSTYNHGSHYPSGATSSATESANNQSGFGNGIWKPHYPSRAPSSATASVNNYPGFENGPSAYSHGSPYTNSAPASVTANAGNYGYNYPYRSSFNNAYTTNNPYASTNFVDQFGRTLYNGIPSSINSLNANVANYNAYFRKWLQNQLPRIYKPPGYWY